MCCNIGSERLRRPFSGPRPRSVLPPLPSDTSCGRCLAIGGRACAPCSSVVICARTTQSASHLNTTAPMTRAPAHSLLARPYTAKTVKEAEEFTYTLKLDESVARTKDVIVDITSTTTRQGFNCTVSNTVSSTSLSLSIHPWTPLTPNTKPSTLARLTRFPKTLRTKTQTKLF